MIRGMDNRFYVYLYLREVDSVAGEKGSPYYVGKGSGNRAFSKRPNRPSNNDCIWIWKDGLTEEEAFWEERRLIFIYGRIDRNTGILRNRTDGGDGIAGCVMSPRTDAHCKAISLAKTGKRVMSDAQYVAIADKLRGRKFSTEFGAAITARQVGQRFSSERCRNISNALKGKWSPTPEQRAKMSATRKGRPLSEKNRAGISAALKGKPKSEAQKTKQREAMLVFWASRRASTI